MRERERLVGGSDHSSSLGDAPSLRILSLNPHLDDNQIWNAHATSIRSIDPEFYTRRQVTQAAILLTQLRNFDVVVFCNNARLATVLGSLKRLARLNTRVILEEMFVDVSPRGSARFGERFRRRVRRSLYSILANVMDRMVVHTSAEVDLLAESLRVPRSRFHFIPYFHYNIPDQVAEEGDYVLAIGRHRDFQCFLRAVGDALWPAVIVAGETDREEIGESLPRSVKVRYEVTFAEYRSMIAGARIVVLPLFGEMWRRSLGQIAAFEAAIMRKPLVVADTFHFRDYFREGEVMRYEAGSSESLRAQIDFLMGNPEAAVTMTARAYDRVTSQFTHTKYVENLLRACADWSESGFSGAPL